MDESTYHYPNPLKTKAKVKHPYPGMAALYAVSGIGPLLQSEKKIEALELLSVYCHEIREILALESLEVTLERFSILMDQLDILVNQRPQNVNLEGQDSTGRPQLWPVSSTVWTKLSPLVVRGLLSSKKNSGDRGEVERPVLEAIRVVLEEELYHFQGKLSEINTTLMKKV